MLTLLPDLTFPVTSKQADALMVCLTQLNLMEGSLHEKQQRALSILFHAYDLWLKTHGALDYRSPDGHRRLVEHSEALLSGSPVTTRVGDLAAAHLAIDHHDTQMRLKERGLPPISSDVSTLLNECRDYAQFPIEMLKRISLALDLMGKRKLI